MRRWLNFTFFVIGAIGLIALHEWGAQGLYDFDHHGDDINLAVRMLLWVLFGTHLLFAGIMLIQARTWDRAQESTFRFISVKSLFWGYFAATVKPDSGIRIPDTYLFVLIALTTIDVDVQLIRRYLLGRRR